tara:strand:- start:636 stop:1097 length:462 start_codon:yes stop_codon:yes gene_type:complete
VSPQEELAEDFAQHYVRLGMTTTAARVLGHLLVEPSGRADAPSLAAALGVAKSSMSVALATLETLGLVVRSRPPRERRDSYALGDDAFEKAFASKLPALSSFAALADRGLELAEPDSSSAQRLERMRAFYAFMLREFPKLLDQWQRESVGGQT